MSAPQSQTTDVAQVLWSEFSGWDSPLIFVTKSGAIGMDVGGNVIVMTVREWHGLAEREIASR